MEELSETKTSRGRLSLLTVLRTRLLLGMFYPVHQRTAFRFFAWLYCFSLAFSLSTGIINIMNDRGAPLIFVMPMIIEYNANVLISLLTGEEHIFNFLKRVQLTDGELGYNSLPLMTRAARYIYLIFVVEKALLLINNIFESLNSVYFTIITLMLSLGLNINSLITILPLDLLRIRLRLLGQSLETNLSPSSNNNTDEQIKILWDSLKLYRDLIDNLSNLFSSQKIQIFIGICCSFTSLVVNGANSINKIKYDSGTEKSMIPSITTMWPIILTCLHTCLPAVFSELLSREVDQLKTALANQLLACEDERLLSELEYAAQYLELRPFSLRLHRACAYDGAFVLAFFGLTITYLLVIVQIFGII